MVTDSEKSETVVEAFKKRKLAHSALHRIHAIIEDFEQDRVTDLRLAWIGLGIILVVLGVAAYFFLGSDSLTFS